jgi:hypothetical protein
VTPVRLSLLPQDFSFEIDGRKTADIAIAVFEDSLLALG